MSAKNSKPGSKRTILKRRNGAYVFARDEGGVMHIYRLRVVNGNPLENFAAELDRSRVALEDSTADVVEDAHDIPGARSAIAVYDWSMQLRALKDALER
jgi:hypothetical protein